MLTSSPLKRFLLAVFSILFVCTFPIVIASSTPKFLHSGVDQGFPDRTVWDIEVDRLGQVWFATSKGLARFDGHDFKIFRNISNQKHNYSANIVRSILLSRKDQMLVGTHAGLGILDTINNTVEPLLIQLDKNVYLDEHIIHSIYQSENGVIWVGTKAGLLALDEHSFKVLYSNLVPFSHPNYSEARVNTIIDDGDRLFFGSNRGLYKLNKNTLEITPLSLKNAKNSSYIAKSLFRRDNGELLLGTNIGLFQVPSSGHLLEKANVFEQPEYILSIEEDQNQRLWIGTLYNGIFYINDNNQVLHFQYEKGNPHSISDVDIYSLKFDSTGTLWLGTFNNGVDRIDPLTLNFEFFDDSESSLPCLESAVIYSVYHQEEDVFWLGTQQGLGLINLKNSTCQFFTDRSMSKVTLSNIDVSHIFPDTHNPSIIHVSTIKGVDSIDTTSLKKVPSTNIFPKLSIYDQLVLKSGEQYLATLTGLFKQSTPNGTFTRVVSDDRNLENTSFFQIMSNSKDQLFIASRKGLLTLNDTGKVERTNWSDGVTNDAIRAMHIDQDDNVWIGIDNSGLHQFDSTGALLKSFTDINRIPVISGFSSIEETRNGDLWISGSKGITHLIPSTGETTNYRNRDGLQGDFFTRGASFLSENGSVYFGGRNGLNRFNPLKIKPNKISPNIVLTKMFYFNNEIKFGETKNGFSLERPISSMELIEFSHKDYSFGFEFSALHYSDPARNQYAYKLQNWDENWNYTSAGFRRANYSNLPPGEYEFLVKASNHHGIWNEQPLRVKIRVLPAPWASPTAYTLYGLFFILAIFFFIKYRTKALRLKAQQLEASVVERTQELALEKNKVEMLLSRKKEEFANVSHEFRTPLTLILGPLAQVIKSDIEPTALKKLNIVQRNGYRLLRMVDQLLNLETFRIKSITKKSPQAIGKIIQLIAEAFQDLADEKDIDFSIGKIVSVNFEFTPDAIERIVLNLISNAIKYTKPGGTVEVYCVRLSNNQIMIKVSDTGIGIPANKLDKVFERYQRVLDENSEQVIGAGIGLSLVKELVDFHGGRVEIKSDVGKGTDICVYLPIIGEVVDELIDAGTNDEIIEMELVTVTHQIHPAETEISKSRQSDNDRATVLVIEDNLDMQNYIVESIRDSFHVITAKDGEEGIDIAVSEVPDLIISDIMMPKKDGYQVVNFLRKNNVTSHIPIILLTARGDRDSRLRGWHEKADEYLTKPFDVEELIIRTRSLLDIRNTLRSHFSPNSVTLQQVSTDDASDSIEAKRSHSQEKFIVGLNQVLEELFSEPETKVVDIAKSIYMSERQFHRKLKGIVDMSPKEYLREYRMNKAKELLLMGNPTTTVAIEVGFSSQSYFSRYFKERYGFTATEFIQKNRSNH